MGVLGDGSAWCFCAGGGKAERTKSGILASKGAAVAAVSYPGGWGTGFLIHRNLLLTTHATISSAAAAAAADVRLSHGRLSARLVPQRFFITSPVLDLTLIGLDALDEYQSSPGHQPHFLKPRLNPNLELGSTVFLLGHTGRKDLTVGEGKVVISTDNLIKLSTDGFTWRPGSAGFDTNGNLAFIVCDPMKIAPSSITTPRFSSAPSASLLAPKELPMQFGIPIPVILGWLHQHWDGNLDDISKPKLSPAKNVRSSINSSGHSSSLTHLCSVRTVEQESGSAMRSRWLQGSSSGANPVAACDESIYSDQGSSYDHCNSTPGIYRSLISSNLENDHPSPVHINLPPRPVGPHYLPLPLKLLEPSISGAASTSRNNLPDIREVTPRGNDEVFHGTSYQNYSFSEVHSSSSPPAISDFGDKDGFSSGEETMFSAETRESRNIPSPQDKRVQSIGRGKGLVSQKRWNSHGNLETPNGVLVAQPTSIPLRKPNPNAGTVMQKTHDYFSPTVSSAMKKRNSSPTPAKPRQNVVPSKWAI